MQKQIGNCSISFFAQIVVFDPFANEIGELNSTAADQVHN